MILAVVEQFHDYEPSAYFIDSENLDQSNPVDQEILKSLSKTKGRVVRCFFDASEGEGDDYGTSAKVKKDDLRPAEKILLLDISFE